MGIDNHAIMSRALRYGIDLSPQVYEFACEVFLAGWNASARDASSLIRDAELWRAISGQNLVASGHGRTAPYIAPGTQTPISRKCWALTGDNAVEEVTRTLIQSKEDSIQGDQEMSEELKKKVRETLQEEDIDLRKVWVAYTNTDCTEGRGYDIPIAVCELEVTARRRAKGAYVQGSDGPVREVTLVKLGGVWYAPYGVFHVEGPSLKDISAQSEVDARRAVLEKARAAGLTDEELRLIAK